MFLHNVSSHSCCALPLRSQACSKNKKKNISGLERMSCCLWIIAVFTDCVLTSKPSLIPGHIQLPSRCDQISSLCVPFARAQWRVGSGVYTQHNNLISLENAGPCIVYYVSLGEKKFQGY